MSVLQLFANNAVSLLDAPLSIGGTSIELQHGLGSEFPQPINPGEFFLVTLEDIVNPSKREIVRIIGRINDTLIIDANGRGQENTTPQFWDSSNTLVDHRVTAETMRQAFLQPITSGGVGPQGPKGDTGAQGPKGDTGPAGADGSIGIDGAPGAQGPKGDTGAQGPAGPKGDTGPQGLPGADGANASVTGSNQPAVAISPVETLSVTEPLPYNDLKRGHKFWVTLYCSSNGLAETFEVLAIIQGILSVSPVVSWTRTNRIGYNFAGTLTLNLDTTNNTLSLDWFNQEPVLLVTVTVAHLSL